MDKQNYELAEEDYINGMKYKEIAEKYNVSINTVKSWKTRYKWRRIKTKKVIKIKHKIINCNIEQNTEIKYEVWKDIKEYEGLYQVSNLGRVKCLGNNRNKKEKILSQAKNSKGYLYVHLSKNNKKRTVAVHILVAQAFIPNILNLPEVNHKDEDKINNYSSNLEWCTRRYNNTYGSRIEKAISTRMLKKVNEL